MNTAIFKKRQTSRRLKTGLATKATPPLARVLVVEDDPLSQETLSQQLTQMGCSVEMVGDGPQGMSSLQQHAFDVVLITCDSPVIDVFETIGSIRRQADESVGGLGDPIVVVGMMANRGRITRERFLAAGIHDCLLRPLDPDRLRRAVNRCGANATRAAEEAEESPKPRFVVPDLVPDREAVFMTAG